jgi:hypothetical protein
MGWKLLPPAAKQRLRRRAAARARAAKEIGHGKGALGPKAAKKAKAHPDLRLPNPEDEYDV